MKVIELEERLLQLERTVLDLGAELFAAKAELTTVKGSYDYFRDVFKGLKALLDDKGLISIDDFECAVEFGKVLSDVPVCDAAEEFLEKAKKSGH